MTVQIGWRLTAESLCDAMNAMYGGSDGVDVLTVTTRQARVLFGMRGAEIRQARRDPLPIPAHLRGQYLQNRFMVSD